MWVCLKMGDDTNVGELCVSTTIGNVPLGMGLRLYATLKINAHELVGKGGLTHS
jgi:hypothetical protein